MLLRASYSLTIVLLAVIVLAWVLFFKGRRKPPSAGRPGADAPIATMLACAHCGLHVPKAEALFDAAGRLYALGLRGREAAR